MGIGRSIRRAVRRVTRAVRRVARDPFGEAMDWVEDAQRFTRDTLIDPIINPNQDAMKAQANAMKEQQDLAQKEYEEAKQKAEAEANSIREGEKGKYDNVGSALGSLLEEEDQMLGVVGKKKKSAL